MSKCTCIEQNGHEQDCPSRPLRPGDYVRWEGVGDGWSLWLEGELMSLEHSQSTMMRHIARINVKRSRDFTVGSTPAVVVGNGRTLRRCERAGWDRNPSVPFSLTTSGGIEITGSVPAKECDACCIPGATAATGRCSHGHLYRSKVRDATPKHVPVLYDGLTAEQCLELYVERQQEHGDSADCYMMTPRQLAAARELWSAQLRAKREAAKEKERCAVTYCEVDADE